MYLVRQQGFNTLHKVQKEIQNQGFPLQSLIDAFVILISGILLMIPGFFTDAIGFMGLIPITRFFIGKALIGLFIKNRSNFAYKSKQDINDPIEGEFEEMDNKDEN